MLELLRETLQVLSTKFFLSLVQLDDRQANGSPDSHLIRLSKLRGRGTTGRMKIRF